MEKFNLIEEMSLKEILDFIINKFGVRDIVDTWGTDIQILLPLIESLISAKEKEKSLDARFQRLMDKLG